ncbi:hypothetical protein TeGR_g9848 [Tetraparma gracilis]|uniref:tRNA pseudouridine synthase n=1 Tax=Tetraparma gracilis TaxID=2962635 RepID=A0ABQ6NAW3_9STRA|nr:hypothetical protein TeGR_g9848 [Tetraparma gracilis]
MSRLTQRHAYLRRRPAIPYPRPPPLLLPRKVALVLLLLARARAFTQPLFPWLPARALSSFSAASLPASELTDPPILPPRYRYRGTLAYDGTYFSGWQVQSAGSQKAPRHRTVQGELAAAIRASCADLGLPLPERFCVVGAGRTDTGVHAAGQAFHFDLPSPPPPGLSLPSVALRLPPDVRLLSLSPAAPDFHAILSSSSKTYAYRISLAPVPDPFGRCYRHHVYYPLDLGLLRRALSLFVGRRDFRAFAGQVAQKEAKTGKPVDTVREVYSAELVDEGSGCYRISFRLKGALYKMVRNLVGAALGVAAGKVPLAELERLMEEAPGREGNRSKPAPAGGLTMECVQYRGEE